MSRLLSFLKKKDKDAGIDYSGSPPLSPKSDKTKERPETKPVKQIKKRHHRREKRKAPLPEGGGGGGAIIAPIVEDGGGGEVQESVGDSLIDHNIDANGNSMTGKGKTASLDIGGLTTAALTSKSTEGEADSLRDVDSICEDETTNGIVSVEIDTSVVSAEPYFVDEMIQDSVGAGPSENGTKKDANGTKEGASSGATPLSVVIDGCDPGDGLKYVSSFSDSGENILIDDFMDEALDDLEDDLDEEDEAHLNGTVESSETTDQEESSVRLATPVNCQPETDSVGVASNANEPCENGSLLETSTNGHTDTSDRSSSLCGGRLLSTDTVGTVYSSCDAGSDHFESAFEDFPSSTNGGEAADVVLVVSGRVADDGETATDDGLEVNLRPKNTSGNGSDLNTADEFTGADMEKLEVCFEVESKGRTSAIVEGIIETRNCLVSTADEDQPEMLETFDETHVLDESFDALEVSVGSASDTLRQSVPNTPKDEVASLGIASAKETDKALEESEQKALNSPSVVGVAEKGPHIDSARSNSPTEPQPVNIEVSHSDPSVESDTKDDRSRPESVETNGAPSQSLDDSSVSLRDASNVTESSHTNLVNGDVSKLNTEEPVALDTSSTDTGVPNTGCEERICGDENDIPEEEINSSRPDVDISIISDDSTEIPRASTPAGNRTDKGDEGQDDDEVCDLLGDGGAVVGADTEPKPASDSRKEQDSLDLMLGAYKPEASDTSESRTGPAAVKLLLSPKVSDGFDANESLTGPAAMELPLSPKVSDGLEASDSRTGPAEVESLISPDASASSDTPSTPSGSSRKSARVLEQQVSLEDELEKHGSIIEDEAEAQLAQRRAARAEARELRLKELERQQQQNPENADDASDTSDGGSGGRLGSRSSARSTPAPSTVPPPPPLPHYSRRSSEESNTDEPACKDVRELEEKFRVAMINNASLDNDKTRLTFQIEELKDCRTDLTEQLTQLKKEHKKKCSEHEQLRKVYAKLQEESKTVRRVLEERDELIQEYGLVVVGAGDEDDEDGDDEDDEALVAREETEDGLVLPRPVPMKRVLLTQEAAEILQQGAAKGSLEWRLRRVVERKRELEDELRRVNLELAEQVNTQRQSNCIDSNIQKEANKTVNEYKFRVQKAEAEVSSLQANVNRLEALVTRFKAQTEELERSEEDLKAEKRRLQRERREIQEKCDELETSKNYIKRQYEKLLHDRQGARH